MLDEPTNHLDLESREALEAALEAFPGTILFVSHDRAILDAVPDRIVAVEDLHAALVRRGLGRSRPRAPRGSATRGREHAQAAQGAARTQDRPDRAREASRHRSPLLERQVAELEARLAADWTNMDTLAAHTAAREELQRQLTRWEELFEESQVDAPDAEPAPS